jgi:hypothetical protein
MVTKAAGGMMTFPQENNESLTFVLDKPIRQGQSVHIVSVTKEEIRRVLGAIGSIKSPAKAEASRKNGKLGGRPKKKKK